jgi:hypothetical protein
MLKQMQTQRRADSRPPLPHQDEFPAEYSLARLLSSRAGLRFLCYPHPQLEINRWLLFFGQRQLSPNSTVSSHDAGQGWPVERREQVTRVEAVRVNGQPEELAGFGGKAAAFNGWHEPDESRDSRPDL